MSSEAPDTPSQPQAYPFSSLPSGIINYRRESMRMAHGLSNDAYIVMEGADFTQTLIGVVGKAFGSSGNIVSVDQRGAVLNERAVRNLASRLKGCMFAFYPEMVYQPRVDAFRKCYPRSAFANVDPLTLSTTEIAYGLNEIVDDMRSEAKLLTRTPTAFSEHVKDETKVSALQAALGSILEEKKAITSIGLKLIHKATAVKNSEQAYDVRDLIFSRKRLGAEALMNGEPEPLIDIDLKHTSPGTVLADINRYREVLLEKTNKLRICHIFISVDYSLFSGLYADVTVLLHADFKGDPFMVAAELGECWSDLAEGGGFFINRNALGDPLARRFAIENADTFNYLIFNLKCAAKKNQFFHPKSAAGVETFFWDKNPQLVEVNHAG
jgi:hypothetical protein